MTKTCIYMDKPILAGQATLDKSKELMYKVYYVNLIPKCMQKLRLLYMDTDSFVL